jgi:hypothetical protein
MEEKRTEAALIEVFPRGDRKVVGGLIPSGKSGRRFGVIRLALDYSLALHQRARPIFQSHHMPSPVRPVTGRCQQVTASDVGASGAMESPQFILDNRFYQ